ncbi:MAG TPA: sulfurtransferase complex subunit TusB [Rhodocyclaceae bacterium]|nr:sulfurtransferase complex subunit TusB [Rhodocyclaceae bacterium]HMV52715.1 sulfurtransferase complex subunit TusB [Rhodocyclaceae bacterium]HNB78198.1 sulfurtransferase complex subunit TusB [Rhodocyclaceae bacterium]HNC60294.1 sulfurtransferase complex subunit TusB [Rhodocyclaceae bacterium]HNH11994.1 sulfurtransferase complex subunit TusB [Rhodocyclaceae bacterium]
MLHIINKSSLERGSLDSCLELIGTGTLLLIEDAVYAATRGHASSGKLSEIAAKRNVFVLVPDCEARGVADRLIEGVKAVDYGGFVDLVAENPNCHSWL